MEIRVGSLVDNTEAMSNFWCSNKSHIGFAHFAETHEKLFVKAIFDIFHSYFWQLFLPTENQELCFIEIIWNFLKKYQNNTS